MHARSKTIESFASELAAMARAAAHHPHEETGGELLGTFQRDGKPVLWAATGPGPKATHGLTHFRQDAQFLRRAVRLSEQRYGLCHLGSWHSHHALGLTEPSRGDIRTAQRALQVTGAVSCVLGILTVTHNVGMRFFLVDRWGSAPLRLQVLSRPSPVRLAEQALQRSAP